MKRGRVIHQNFVPEHYRAALNQERHDSDPDLLTQRETFPDSQQKRAGFEARPAKEPAAAKHLQQCHIPQQLHLRLPTN